MLLRPSISLPTADPTKVPERDTLECSSTSTSMVIQLKPFKVSFEPRDGRVLDRWVEENLRATEGAMKCDMEEGEG